MMIVSKGTVGKPPACPETLDSVNLKSAQDKFIKQGIEKLINILSDEVLCILLIIRVSVRYKSSLSAGKETVIKNEPMCR